MINVAELLEDAPKGMKLYSPLFGEVEFLCVDSDNNILVATERRSNYLFTANGTFHMYDKFYPQAECLLFPSKDCRTWEGWKLPLEPKFKVGDWIANDYCAGKVIALTDDAYLLDSGQGIPFSCEHNAHLWTIQDAKDGDVICTPNNNIFIYKCKGSGAQIYDYCGLYHGKFEPDSSSPNGAYNSCDGYAPATKEQRDLLFQKMKEAGYQWNADKKELRKIKPHYDIKNFKPFQKVLVRQDDSCTWGVSFFGRYDEMFMCCSNVCFAQCIPFNEETKHLLGTSDPCDKQYINW